MHFLDINQLSQLEVYRLINRALYFKQYQRFPNYNEHTIAQLFYEPSTRTRVSFELAAKHLAMSVINLDIAHSSEHKGELIADTISTLAAMGIGYFVIRHPHNNVPKDLAQSIAMPIHIINAGDGVNAHPSQALLDMMTIIEHKPVLTQLKIAMVGDIKHSRVARSFQAICQLFEVKELALVAPLVWQPEKLQYGYITDDLHQGLIHADVVICLRTQHERLLHTEHMDLDQYRRNFALTAHTLAYAKPDAIIMHPGPVHHNVEIDSSLVACAQSVILSQVTNGVYARMAILESLITRANS